MMSGYFPMWFHWLLCGLITSVVWLVVMIIGFSCIGFPRRRERELEHYVKELERWREEEEDRGEEVR